jgi:hypothetical protein
MRQMFFRRLCRAAVGASLPEPEEPKQWLKDKFEENPREVTMRCAALLFGLVLLATPAHAGPRSEYVTMMLQAFAAKMECPGTDVVYQDLVQKAQDMQQPDGTTEQVRKAIAFMHTGGKMGERADDTLMQEVAIATRTTDLDQKRLGMTTWCETQKGKLAGFIRAKN